MWLVSRFRGKRMRTSGSGHECRRFEVPTPPAANSCGNFKSKSGTRIIDLLVPLCFRSSCQSGPPCITNFGSGALERVGLLSLASESCSFKHPRNFTRQRFAVLDAIGDHAECQGLCLGASLELRCTIDENARKRGHFRNPAAVFLAFAFDLQRRRLAM